MSNYVLVKAQFRLNDNIYETSIQILQEPGDSLYAIMDKAFDNMRALVANRQRLDPRTPIDGSVTDVTVYPNECEAVGPQSVRVAELEELFAALNLIESWIKADQQNGPEQQQKLAVVSSLRRKIANFGK